MIGKTISHYRILEKLGEGGMGVVYKAEDTTLKRTVALKFLPKELEAHEPERARFLHEAQAASALNHPHICTIHDLQDHEGEYFIVMEYVDGKTLREIIPIRETADAIAYAIQIGEALQEAHSHGIVHRDVKPENIMVNAKNQIKVMDFGLAKLKGSLKLTKTSSTVGTLAYMAPEQIQGGEVDARGDIFSFGIMLFEMLTGQLPFRGEHQAAMMYSIVNEEPEPIERYMPNASPLLANIIQRALEKDPRDRFQSVADMVIELRRVQKKTSRVSRAWLGEKPAAALGHGAPDGTRVEPAISKKRFKRAAWIGTGIIVVFGIITATYVLFLRHPPQIELNPDMTFRVLPIPSTQVGSPGLSRDGNWTAFPAADANSNWDIYFMNTTSGESRRITADSSMWINDADISPDGSQIVYNRVDASRIDMEIAVVSTIGGSSKRIAAGRVFFARWRPDGQRIGYVRGKLYGRQSGEAEIWSTKPDGSDDRRELVDSTSGRARRFSWSPDGRSICWIKDLSAQCSEVVVYDLSTKKARQVTFENKDIMDVHWAPNDQIIFSSNKSGNNNLWMVPASGGATTQITKGTGRDYAAAVSHDGSKLLYLQQQEVSHLWIAGTDGSNPRQITFDDAFIYAISFSPDDKEVLFALSPPFVMESFVCSVDRGGKNRKKLTSGGEDVWDPVKSPDGKWIIYAALSLGDPRDSSRVYLIDARNPTAPKAIGKGWPVRWVDDKTFLTHDNVSYSTWLCSIDGGTRERFFEDSTWAIPLQGGKYIGYYDMRSGREGLWIAAAPGMKDPDLPSPRKLPFSGDQGAFDKTGRFFYWVKNAGELRRFSIPSGKEEIIHRAIPGLTFSPFSSLDITYDGKEIAYTDARFNSKLIMIEHVFK